MNRVTFAVLVAAVVAALTVLVPAQAMTTRKLTGTVGPGFTITLKQGTKSVKTLRAGSYTIKVADKGDIHNFHLIGPGVNKKTGVSSTGTQTWTVRLRAGKYTFQCDPHATSGMRGTFKVTS
jgi:plastocyanin